jgi:hypothetical protein
MIMLDEIKVKIKAIPHEIIFAVGIISLVPGIMGNIFLLIAGGLLILIAYIKRHIDGDE